MAFTEIAFTRVNCDACDLVARIHNAACDLGLRQPPAPRAKPCHCRIITDFLVGDSTYVAKELEIIRNLTPSADQFDGY